METRGTCSAQGSVGAEGEGRSVAISLPPVSRALTSGREVVIVDELTLLDFVSVLDYDDPVFLLSVDPLLRKLYGACPKRVPHDAVDISAATSGGRGSSLCVTSRPHHSVCATSWGKRYELGCGGGTICTNYFGRRLSVTDHDRRPLPQTDSQGPARSRRLDDSAPDKELPDQCRSDQCQQPRHAVLPDEGCLEPRNSSRRRGAGLRSRERRDAFRPGSVLHGPCARQRRRQHLGGRWQRLVQGRQHHCRPSSR